MEQENNANLTVVCLFIRTEKNQKNQKQKQRGKECLSPFCTSHILSGAISMDLWSISMSSGFE